ncbi:hypothetical protein Nepgr_028059 [Nepenthes gracilis]|uniref:Uncharacterized protein n=1 Tax=Nepenthes gracilis TaxID=150966 RepID=A0AAD3TBQ3_NEPGR|nr:hypothetical protein Nepgr_028059 [Nepenthes gracilis]
MAFSGSLFPSTSIKLSTCLHGEALTSASSSSRYYMGAHFTFSPSSLSGNSGKKFVVVSKRLSGLEETMRIRRERELQATKPSRPPH